MKYFPEGFPPMPDRIAERRLEYYFEQFVMRRFDRYGFGHFALACYAALPSVLTPDLLHKLWLNFKPYRLQGQALNIHPVAPTDLLLSPLLEEIGHELYEMVPPVRKALLEYLQLLTASPDQNFLGFQPLTDVAQFLLEYARRDRSHGHADDDAFREAQEWTALSYLDPSAAFTKVSKAFADTTNPQEKLRYRDAIEKMASRFEVKIHHPDAKLPEGYPAMRALTQVLRDLALNRQRQLEEYEHLFKNPELLSDKPLQQERIVSIPVPDAVQERMAGASAPPVRKVRALVVGVGEASVARFGTPEGEEEARLFADCLEELVSGLHLEMTVLAGKEATKEAVMKAWQKITEAALQQDDLLFYISANSKLSKDGHCQVACYDTSNMTDDAVWLTDSEFQALTKKTAAQSVTAVLAVNHAATYHWLDPLEERNLVLATCKKDQIPHLIKERIDGHYCSFTYALVEELKASNNLRISNRQLFIRALQRFVRLEPVKKTYGGKLRELHAPQIIGSPAALNRFFLDGGNQLVLLQNLLRYNGFYHLPSSGQWDLETSKALRSARAAASLPEEANKQELSIRLTDYGENREAEQVPVFLFVFSDLGSSMPSIRKEREFIEGLLRKALHQAKVELLFLQEPGTQEVERILSGEQYRNRLHWLHFAGMMGKSVTKEGSSEGLQLENGILDMGRLMSLLEYQQNIRMVFLNACNSSDAAEWVAGCGAWAAVGVRGLIPDSRAFQLASSFYENICRGDRIETAFDKSTEALDTSFSKRFSVHTAVGIVDEDQDFSQGILLFKSIWALRKLQEWRLSIYRRLSPLLHGDTPLLATSPPAHLYQQLLKHFIVVKTSEGERLGMVIGHVGKCRAAITHTTAMGSHEKIQFISLETEEAIHIPVDSAQHPLCDKYDFFLEISDELDDGQLALAKGHVAVLAGLNSPSENGLLLSWNLMSGVLEFCRADITSRWRHDAVITPHDAAHKGKVVSGKRALNESKEGDINTLDMTEKELRRYHGCFVFTKEGDFLGTAYYDYSDSAQLLLARFDEGCQQAAKEEFDSSPLVRMILEMGVWMSSDTFYDANQIFAITSKLVEHNCDATQLGGLIELAPNKAVAEICSIAFSMNARVFLSQMNKEADKLNANTTYAFFKELCVANRWPDTEHLALLLTYTFLEKLKNQQVYSGVIKEKVPGEAKRFSDLFGECWFKPSTAQGPGGMGLPSDSTMLQDGGWMSSLKKCFERLGKSTIAFFEAMHEGKNHLSAIGLVPVSALPAKHRGLGQFLKDWLSYLMSPGTWSAPPAVPAGFNFNFYSLSISVALSRFFMHPAPLSCSPYLSTNNANYTPAIEATNITNYILAIAVESYDPPLRRLHTPKRDCEKIIEILTERYEGFENSPAYVTLLHQPSETTRHGIFEGIRRFRKNKIGKKDTLWVIYAGHGDYSEDTGDGYWIPSTGEKDKISNSDFVNELNAIPAGKIVLLVDSCFAGALAEAESRDGLRKTSKLSCPFIIASSDLEKADDGQEHSPFASVLIRFLKENREGKLKLSKLVDGIVLAIREEEQEPWGRLMKACGVDYGDSRYFLTSKALLEPPPQTLKELIQELYLSV